MNGFHVDDGVGLTEQLATDAAPVVVVSIFEVAPEELDALVAAWAADAAVLKRKPGHISSQLHRGTAESTTMAAYSLWESAHAVRMARADPDLRRGQGRYPTSTVSWHHLFEPIAVPGICLGRPNTQTEGNKGR